MALRRLTKLTTFAALGGYTTYVLHKNDWDARNIGVVRFGRAALTVGQIAADYKFSVSKLQDESDETYQKWSECHDRSAKRLLKLCSTNGGVFIKVGQHIAALDYLVPKEYVTVLKVLHNQGPKSSFSDVRNVIKSELGVELEEVFEDFEPEPIGSASLAQVHRAKLRDGGQTVAVKVQHPKVFQHSLVDMATMDFLFQVISQIFPDFSFVWLADETRRNLPMELDFVNEGHNAEVLGSVLERFSWLRIPKIHWKWTTKRTLVMEFMEGQLITNRAYFDQAHIDTAEVSNRMEQIYSQMIFINGTVHCDPHPGNILVSELDSKKDFEITLLDHGLYTRLTDDFRKNYCYLWLAVLSGDIAEIERCGQAMGIDAHHSRLLSCMISAKPWSAIQRGLQNTPDAATKSKERDELRHQASRYMNAISRILATVDRQLLLIMKTNDLIRSIGHVLGCDERRSFLTMSRCCIEVVQADKLQRSRSWWTSLKIRVQPQWLFFQLSIYSFWLWFTHRPRIAGSPVVE